MHATGHGQVTPSNVFFGYRSYETKAVVTTKEGETAEDLLWLRLGLWEGVGRGPQQRRMGTPQARGPQAVALKDHDSVFDTN